MNLFLGIDPGKTGAWAVIDEKEEVCYADLFEADTFLTFMEADSSCLGVDKPQITLAALEKVHSMPSQGVVSVFTFGENFGLWKGLLKATHTKYVLVTPGMWQGLILDFKITRELGASDESEKSKADRRASNRKVIKEGITAFALRYFPRASNFIKLKKHQGMADALCLALYAKRTWYSDINKA
jgi:crossover junction endodeoxyribonuclease RuvC